jgi:hypothetical protein
VLEKLDLAFNYFQLIIADEPTSNDLINAGHVELSLGNKPKAMEYYLAAISLGNLSLAQFAESLDFDKHFLIANGIDPTEIQLIADFIQFRG